MDRPQDCKTIHNIVVKIEFTKNKKRVRIENRHSMGSCSAKKKGGSLAYF